MNTLYIGCITCSKPIQQAILNSFNPVSLFQIFSPFILLSVIVATLYIKGSKKYIFPSKIPLTSAGVILGIGIGGFIDGILFHQILQWHGMLSNKIPPLSLTAKNLNMFWDGIFHAFTLTITILGIILLYKLIMNRCIITSPKLFIGGLSGGWAIFNIIEGLINHHLFQLHFVKDNGNSALWNALFMLFSILLMGLAIYLLKSVRVAYIQ